MDAYEIGTPVRTDPRSMKTGPDGNLSVHFNWTIPGILKCMADDFVALLSATKVEELPAWVVDDYAHAYPDKSISAIIHCLAHDLFSGQSEVRVDYGKDTYGNPRRPAEDSLVDVHVWSIPTSNPMCVANALSMALHHAGSTNNYSFFASFSPQGEKEGAVRSKDFNLKFGGEVFLIGPGFVLHSSTHTRLRALEAKAAELNAQTVNLDNATCVTTYEMDD